MILVRVFLSFCCFLCANFAEAQISEWDRFQKNPSDYMSEIPTKHGSTNVPVVKRRIGAYEKFEARLEQWPELGKPRYFESQPRMKKSVESFFNLREFAGASLEPIFSLEGLAAAGLKKATLEKQPWSGSYWPISEGGLASRYDWVYPPTESLGTWKDYYGAMKKGGSLKEVLQRADPAELDSLSPAEKYDLLIAGKDELEKHPYGFLTAAMWEEGKSYANRSGRVEGWMGYCHGWAPAALVEDRPVRPVSATTQDGNQIQFYPSDLKGVSTLLWAKGNYSQHFLGGRCGSKNPLTNGASGRILDAGCFDVNPGIWHLVIANQLGQLHRGLVIDATYDYEVWNQPVFSYRYTYFNPLTGKRTEDLKEASVRPQDYLNDKFKKFRKSGIASIVGIEMSIKYTSETLADHSATDNEEQDSIREVTYLYDLELDQSGEVTGGEWYKNAHPDFLWVPSDAARPLSAAEAYLNHEEKWDITKPLPKFWRDIAVQTALSSGEALAKIVEPLMEEGKAIR